MRVLVIEVPGLNLGHIGCYGNEWVATPTLDQLAAEGVVFDQHYADRPESARVYDAWQTGRYHLPFPEEKERAFLPHSPCPFSLLRERGIATYWLTGQTGRVGPAALAGWQHVGRVLPASSDADTQDQTLGAALEALDQLASQERWLLRVDFSTLLPPWHVPEKLRNVYHSPGGEEGDLPAPLDVCDSEESAEPDEMPFLRSQDHYAAAVTYLDAGIGHVLDELEARGLGDDLLLLVTTAYGQEIDRRDVASNRPTLLHEELAHVPLIFRLPRREEAGRRIAALTQTVDLLPTWFDAFDLPAPPVHGHSLLPLARGKANQIRAYACTGLRTGDSVEWALRTPEWYFLLPVRQLSSDQPPRPELYVKPDDRWEVNDVYQHHLELAEHLQGVLRSFVDAIGRPGPLQAPDLGDLDTLSPTREPIDEPTSTVGGTQP